MLLAPSQGSAQTLRSFAILAGAVGAGVGLAVGALIHKTTIVYPEPEKRTFVVPAISRGAVGVWVSRRW
jgi:hypothetical protein